jgi:hypothetical protein
MELQQDEPTHRNKKDMPTSDSYTNKSAFSARPGLALVLLFDHGGCSVTDKQSGKPKDSPLVRVSGEEFNQYSLRRNLF